MDPNRSKIDHDDTADKGARDSVNPDDSRSGDATDNGRPREIGGRGGLDPVRYGDWEKNGRCIDF